MEPLASLREAFTAQIYERVFDAVRTDSTTTGHFGDNTTNANIYAARRIGSSYLQPRWRARRHFLFALGSEAGTGGSVAARATTLRPHGPFVRS
jgi:hypothetical protein